MKMSNKTTRQGETLKNSFGDFGGFSPLNLSRIIELEFEILNFLDSCLWKIFQKREEINTKKYLFSVGDKRTHSWSFIRRNIKYDPIWIKWNRLQQFWISQNLQKSYRLGSNFAFDIKPSRPCAIDQYFVIY